MRKAAALGPRLAAAAQMLGTAETIWDVGCDHGHLAAALVLSGAAERVIASDISTASVAKANRLVDSLGLFDRVTVVRADGLSGFSPSGEYKLVICGMGGELIAQLLDGSDLAKAAELIVMQPMRGEEELRSFLYNNGFGIMDEAVAEEDGRFYQLIAAKYGEPCEIPDWFPKEYFRFGWVMCEKPDDNVAALLSSFRSGHAARLEKAVQHGKTPIKLVRELEAVDSIISHRASACLCGRLPSSGGEHE